MMKLTSLVFLAIVLASAVVAVDNWSKYNGDMVIRTWGRTKDHVNYLRELQDTHDTLDFWTLPGTIGLPVDIRVAAEEYPVLSRLLEKHNLEHKVKVDDLAREIQRERLVVETRRTLKQTSKEYDFHNYHPYEVVVDYLNQLAASNPLTNTSVIGKTYEGRDIVMATISTGSDSNKPVIHLDCTVHAREWISTASCVWFINQLATQYGIDAEVTAIVDGFDWLITPISNPDGYVYTWTTDRLWRKNRVPTDSALGCHGVDFNRNFDSNFGGSGSSNLACQLTYHGPSPFSEAETQAMRDVLIAYRPRVKAAVSIHSYSQLWMSPFGYKYDVPGDNEEMLRVMTAGVNALQATYGTVYQFGNHAETLYLASGTTLDYAYEVEGIVYAYLIELRDTGDYGFELPPSQIEPTATETFNGLKAMATAILSSKTSQ